MTYHEFINNIIGTRGRFNCGDEYHERHHIVPKCMGGTNDEDNLIDLFAREHFIAHKLLAQENPDNNSLIYAWCCMAFAKNDYECRYELSPEEYEEARITLSAARKGVKSGSPSDETVNKIRQGLKSAWENNDALREEYSIRMKQRWADDAYRAIVTQNMRESCPHRSGEDHPMYGKTHSEETRAKMRENHADFTGEKHPMYGRHHSDESRLKISLHHADFSGSNHPRSRAVAQYDKNGNFILLWSCISDAAKELGIHRSDISTCCSNKGKLKSAGGFVWYYADDPTQPDPTKIIPNKMIKGEYK